MGCLVQALLGSIERLRCNRTYVDCGGGDIASQTSPSNLLD